MAMPATVARTNAPRLHLASIGSSVDIAVVRASAGRTSTLSGVSSDPPGAPRGLVKAPRSRALQVWGLLLPLSAEEVMANSGYRCRWDPPNRPGGAGGRRDAGYGCGPANPERALSSAG